MAQPLYGNNSVCDNIPCSEPSIIKQTDYKIFVFWYQGEDEMPELVNACYRQLIKNNDNVALITKDNLSKWCTISKMIMQKVEKQVISLTHFSDIVRATLLSKYGGLWIDATCWVPGKISPEIYSYSFFSCKNNNSYEMPYWSRSRWCTWIMGTNVSENVLFTKLKMLMQSIAIKERAWIDYLLLDYLMSYFYETDVSIKHEIEALQENNTERNTLWRLMNKPFDPNKYNELTQTNWVFKLSYKTHLQKKTKDGQETFYGHICSQSISDKEKLRIR